MAVISCQQSGKWIVKQRVFPFGLHCPVVRDPKRSVGNLLDRGIAHPVLLCPMPVRGGVTWRNLRFLRAQVQIVSIASHRTYEDVLERSRTTQARILGMLDLA
ncbi:MAG TPA: hypothetical protein VM709_07795 [Candidatus Sulfotelmatobacter sp.]|nr:hypothetical protein [Candidatus Sulfotelmatobacter sp.]